MHRNPAVRVLTLVVLGLFAASAQAQDKVTLKLNLPVGKAWKSVVAMDMQMNMVSKTADGDQNMEQKIAMSLSSTMTPLEVDDGSPSKFKVSYGDDCKISVTMGAQQQNVPFPLAGKTLTVTKAKDGSVQVEPAEGLDPQTKEMLKNAMDSAKAFFPDNPVAPGDTWEVKPDAAAKMFQVTNPKGSIQCKLEKLAEQQGMKVAQVSVKGTMSGMAGGVDTTVDLAGPVVIDVATGQTLSSEMKANMTMKGPQASGTGTMTAKQTNTPAD